MLRRLIGGLVLLYGLATVLLPVFVLNKLIFIPLFFLSICALISRPVKIFAPVLVFMIFLYGFLLGEVNGADPELARQMLLASTSLFLIYVIYAFDVDMGFTVRLIGALFATVMCIFSFSVMLAPDSALSTLLLNFYIANDLGFYGVRDFGGLDMFMLHHRSTPFLLVPLSMFFLDFLKSRKLLPLSLVVVMLVAIICSASRGLMVMAVVALFVLFFYQKRWGVRLILLLVAIPLLAFVLDYLVVQTSFFNAGEQSNSIKIGHVLSFLEVADWKMLIFGNGLGSYFYTEGYGRLVSQTEITLLDSIRYVGIPLTTVLFAAFLFPKTKYVSNTNMSSNRLIMFMYVLVSLSNPVLFNSFGFFVILWYWSMLISVQKPVPVCAEVRGSVE
ncbi:hypothetical protein [Pseudomonas sp. GXZC]|uniref:hypothetical protein n=1 Tax=Pseudomonas sp. GXZC TaxID=3003351 RepID=UPI0022A9FF9C|nr:hypothetical protein [Pseudomonas sp. GXZC]WAT30629.1 hypothetical protein OZ428_09865 [Pseudomonas sp. GXZC]